MERASKILLVELCANGDCLYATAVARQIKHDYPGCHLTWAIAGFCKSIIFHNPYVDAIMEVNDAPKNDLAAFRRFKKRILRQKKEGLWDDVFITQVIDDNAANYDGCIRSATFRGYKNPITVPVTPVLRISGKEKENVKDFADRNSLSQYKHIVLFEFSPLSGQANITKESALKIAEELVKETGAAIILSSGEHITHTDKRIIDGSVLSIRETAALTHYCTFLIGCSSGITWASTSDAARKLPMVQLLSPTSIYLNSVARDFERHGLSDYELIQVTNLHTDHIIQGVSMALSDFNKAKNKYHQEIPVNFLTTRYIVCNLIIHFQFSAVFKHIRINTKLYGRRLSFYKECIYGALILPSVVTKILWQRTAGR
ncbi:MAG: hypothetical protein WKI04_07175 [Ferruginibacter sp.]